MGGAPERNKNSKQINIGEMTGRLLYVVSLKYIGMMPIGEMCFIPMNIHNELLNDVRQLRWQHLSPVVSTFSTSIRLLSSVFIKHCIVPPSFYLVLSICLSLAVVPHPVFLISGLSLRFGDDVFFLQSKVLCPDTCIHYPVNPSSDHFHNDAVVPSSDHCRTETVLPPSDHYCIESVTTAST